MYKDIIFLARDSLSDCKRESCDEMEKNAVKAVDRKNSGRTKERTDTSSLRSFC
jgi:hypothetical protein